jgi:hydrogenase nickel incorporation protein HypA/HybF
MISLAPSIFVASPWSASFVIFSSISVPVPLPAPPARTLIPCLHRGVVLSSARPLFEPGDRNLQQSSDVHELTVAQSLLDLVLKTARDNAATTVVTARIRIGAGSCLNPDSLAFGFEALAAGTPAAGCRLEIEPFPAPVTCTACRWEGERLDMAELVCPRCQASPLRITGGRELTVGTITVE